MGCFNFSGLNNLWPIIQPIINSNMTIAAIGAIFAIYFALRRVGYKIGATYTWGSNRISAAGFSSVLLINYKDRPVPIFSMDAIINQKSINLKKFEPPIILKPLEALKIDIDPVSNYYTNEGEYDLGLPISGDTVEIFVSTVDKNIKCLFKTPNQHHEVIKKRNLEIISKSTEKYNGHVISDKVAYVIDYVEKDEHKTAFIDVSGFINWNFKPNLLHLNEFENADQIENTLKDTSIGQSLNFIKVSESPYLKDKT